MKSSIGRMRPRLLLPLVAVLLVIAAGCDWPNLDPPGAGPLRYRDSIFDAVTVTQRTRVTSSCPTVIEADRPRVSGANLADSVAEPISAYRGVTRSDP